MRIIIYNDGRFVANWATSRNDLAKFFMFNYLEKFDENSRRTNGTAIEKRWVRITLKSKVNKDFFFMISLREIFIHRDF